MATSVFPVPGVVHGKRILATIIETRAKAGTNTEPWVSVPIDDNNISAGFRDITFQELNNAANHAARWLSQALPATSQPFQHFAYAGPKDLRYPLFALAAAKLQKVMVFPSPLLTREAQLRLLEQTNCELYLRPSEMVEQISNVLRETPHIQKITVPGIEDFFRNDEAAPVIYSKTWDEGKGDPWLVFHTSGTTGNPKAIRYTQQMMTTFDTAASLPELELNVAHHWTRQRLYTPLPALHFIGMMATLSLTTCIHTTCVIGPPITPTAELVTDILRYGNVAGALITPALIDALVLSQEGLQALRELKYIHFVGASLSTQTGNLLAPYTHVVPAIGSTESGGYFTVIHENKDRWEYVSFQKDAGAELHHRMNGIHELVFVRGPQYRLQQIFQLYKDRQTFETNDLFVEHPEHKGMWKIIGRSDDCIYLAHGEGIHASLLEIEIVAHPSVKSALIGGLGRSVPVLLVELVPDADAEDVDAVKRSLEPFIAKANEHCHDVVKLSSERLIIAKKEKPFVTTIKGNPLRLQTLSMYEAEIEALFK
ncbi:ochratoxin A non-ribosomal peptide synthetase [Histoplasma capsulatum G186AR]|uniref:Ochratoxin A non-ribosomal peptide synthetase n=2 Tax=Ajellomyces capsulatus TaxID=5037 RepID=C0NMZ2_AJECG|nr:ochratoxin A non-ribosomal peptide synthetase [Histoplasma capsulatum G186AR]EEH07240.1 ochratoxin A non-ribosomal peptide synthetase [Histoplasma capsulatum G186AR]